MRRHQSKVRSGALLALAAMALGLLAAQAAQAAQRKVMMENFTATW